MKTSVTYRTAGLLAATALFLVLASRSPAPIVEVETPSPAPSVSARKPAAQPKPKSSDNPAAERKEKTPTNKVQATPAAVKFAGTWRGALQGSAAGVVITIVFSPQEDLATVKGMGGVWGDRSGRPTRTGNFISWKFMAESWSLTAAPDGKTAAVTARHWPGGSSTGTVTKAP